LTWLEEYRKIRDALCQPRASVRALLLWRTQDEIMKPDAQHEQQPGRREQATPLKGPPLEAEQTAEPDGQFPENPLSTLDDHQAGDDPVSGNDPNAEGAFPILKSSTRAMRSSG
jgi:hypothetical protein